jgi:hypothetical protein
MHQLPTRRMNKIFINQTKQQPLYNPPLVNWSSNNTDMKQDLPLHRLSNYQNILGYYVKSTAEQLLMSSAFIYMIKQSWKSYNFF